MNYFSLSSYRPTKEYDTYILPLIRQMKHLEELMLSINVYGRSTLIDGIHLENEMLIYLPKLQIFRLDLIYFHYHVIKMIYRVYPFTYEFFLHIARAFPFITELTVLNNRVYNNTGENTNQIKSIIEFHHLTFLTIHFQQDIYIEQFLVDTNTYLPNLINLTISYDNLATVTNNFTRHSTRHNCSKVEILKFTTCPITVHSKEFYLHFPCLELIR
ncbi:unnamed protein product [Adineta steineri]|uniref:Uncharacterized protein n=1 Tax=Adineta steineri TaxID=433720 RepID=A0A813Z8R4_9BILA|nr:unnamed protein product [Adineta steineri]